MHRDFSPFLLAPLFLFLGAAAFAQDTLLGGLSVIQEGIRSKRSSSWDRTGGNKDFIPVNPGQTVVLADIPGSGAIKHIWMTINSPSPYHLRELVLRMYWDGESNPSVEAPVGDFFGTGFGTYHSWHALPLSVQFKALNCYFDMPFGNGVRVAITNDGSAAVRALYYHIDYEQYSSPAQVSKKGRFHAQWRREITKTVPESESKGVNLDGKHNYVFMDAIGQGQFVGVVLNIQGHSTVWWGEGDDMFFIDDELFPPSIHGTGLEDYFGNAWGYQDEFNYPFAGYSRSGNRDREPHEWTGRYSVYRFHIQDPIHFERSLRASIEHGHANSIEADYSSVAYWYQTEPHKPLEPLLPVDKRLPDNFWQIQVLPKELRN